MGYANLYLQTSSISAMADIPVRNSKNGLDCPRCGTSLVNGKAPFYLKEEYVGVFDAVICEMCHYSLFTPSGYDQSMLEAKRYGLIGPPEEVDEKTLESSKLEKTLESSKLEETLESSEQEIIFQKIVVSSNSDNIQRITSDPGSKRVEINSLSNLASMPTLIGYPYKQRHQTKRIQALVK